MISTRPTWTEISRSHLVHNYGLLRRLAGPQTEVVAVIKANAYGHGLAACAQTLENAGAQRFGVTCVEEGVALRRACPEAAILIMSGLCAQEADAAIEHRLTPVVWEAPHLQWLAAAARKHGLRTAEVPVHLEIDAGMSRQGAAPEQIEPLLEHFGPDSPLRLEALMTHFPSPEDRGTTHRQQRRFLDIADRIHARGIPFDALSAGSSAGVLQREPPDCLDAWTAQKQLRRIVRTGIALYGCSPLQAPLDSSVQPKPVLAWKTRIVSLRTIEPGTSVGYDATFTAQRISRLALLPVGYGDGLNRLLSNHGSVLVRGQRAPIAGRISMDHTVVDVTDIPGAASGDEVVLIGEQDGNRTTADDLAAATGTIAYEVLCAISARVPRGMVD
ncbi:MAG TPA: alanine racemase [Acidobacteriaceae bacterium]|jgi:alanine racemase|nr:alanine racemase [Acidobacteriaceae bacterium]